MSNSDVFKFGGHRANAEATNMTREIKILKYTLFTVTLSASRVMPRKTTSGLKEISCLSLIINTV